MTRAVALSFLLFNIACGASRRPADSGAETDADSDAEADADFVDAQQTGCEDYQPDGDRACVPAGAFWFGMIVDDTTCPLPEPQSPWDRTCESGAESVMLYSGIDLAHVIETGAFLIDLREVTNEQYADFVTEGGATPPPAVCDVVIDPVGGCEDFVGATGWSEDGEPPADGLEWPVTCVTRDEAATFCAARGGRLPLSTEWMKAARGAYPSRREFPWADDIPLVWTDGTHEVFNSVLDRVSYRRLGSCFANGETDCWTCDDYGEQVWPEPVTSRPENASPYGLLHVLHNAAEWVEVADTDDGYESNRIDIMSGGYTESYRFMLGCFSECLWTPQISFGISSDPTNEMLASPIARDRNLGFRCAYDLE